MVCIIFIVHTMHDCCAQFKMGLPHAYFESALRSLGGQLSVGDNRGPCRVRALTGRTALASSLLRWRRSMMYVPALGPMRRLGASLYRRPLNQPGRTRSSSTGMAPSLRPRSARHRSSRATNIGFGATAVRSRHHLNSPRRTRACESARLRRARRGNHAPR